MMTMACPSPSPAAMSIPTDVWMDTATAPMRAAVTPPCEKPSQPPHSADRAGTTIHHSHEERLSPFTRTAWKPAHKNTKATPTMVQMVVCSQMPSTSLRNTASVLNRPSEGLVAVLYGEESLLDEDEEKEGGEEEENNEVKEEEEEEEEEVQVELAVPVELEVLLPYALLLKALLLLLG